MGEAKTGLKIYFVRCLFATKNLVTRVEMKCYLYVSPEKYEMRICLVVR